MSAGWLLVVAASALASTHLAAAQNGSTDCRGVAECRELAVGAKDEGDYRRFHDLAWRALQAGPRNDPELMYLLARAQVLSGRPHDALIMLRRLAEQGVVTDAATDEDFARTRALPEWGEVADLVATIVGASRAAPAPPPAPRTPTSTAAPGPTRPASPPPGPSAGRPAVAPAAGASAAVSVPAIPIRPAPTEEAARFTTPRFSIGGLAYDTVSRRFVVGDALGRKLVVVGVGTGRPVDMVRADSAGFEDVAALDIDERRGDLWVVSGTGADAAGALHRLQLVSGRPLRTYRPAPGIGGVRLADLAIAPSGTLFVLDTAGQALLTLARGATELTKTMALALEAPVALASTADEGVLFVAYAAGIARIDLRARTATPLASPSHFDLARFTRIRSHRDGLVGVQSTADDTFQIVRLELSGNGRTVTGAAIIGAPEPSAGMPPPIAISGDDLYRLSDGGGDPDAAVTLKVQRLRLR